MYKVVNLQTGVWGPSKASLSNNIFPKTYQQSIASNDWPGVGADKWTTPFDINWNVAPLNSSTGYFNFTFGNTGHMGYTSVFEIINAHQWIPQRHRVFDANRHYRAIAARGSGLTNSELLVGIPNAFWDPMPTPWVKRKMNFVRKELQNISTIMGACGFYMASASLDDEYYIYGDYTRLGTSTGDTRFYNFYLYPGNTSGGFTWFASYTGSSAAPDSLIQRGITSYRAFLLSHGFTTNINSSKFVDGLTAISGGALANNIAASGSAWQTLGLEYKAAVADWVALHFQDYIEDFKRYNGLTSENNNIASYGYYRTDVAVQGYTSDRWGATYSGLLKQLSTDFVSYPDVTPTSAASNARKSAYYGYNILSSGYGGGYVQRERVGDLDSIHCYGAITNFLSIWRGSAYVHSLDRGKLLFGNSYGYGLSHGINFNYYWQYPDSALQAPVWYVPANYLNSGLPGQTFRATKCYELFGITAAMRYDPTGSLGSTRGNATRCSGNSAPQFISWHLNPVWGITQIGTADNYNPANYLPLKGRHMTLGISCGSISLEQLNITRTTNPGATWNLSYFDPSGFPLPGNTLPAGSLYNQYWTHWYPMAFMAFMYDVYWGRQVAANNVYRALGQQQGVIPTVPGSVWNYAQQPIETWITDQKISGGDLTNASAYEATGDEYTLTYNTFVPTGLTYGYFLSSGAVGTTQIVGEQGPMFYEHMRHQYLHKTIRYIDWNIPQYTCTVSATGGQVGVGGGGVALPFVIGGITSFGVCGAITMALARKVNKVVGECNTRAGGLVNQTVFLAPGNMAERSYVLSGAQKAGGGFIWRITFANPATYPSITVRGSETGITTEYRVAGVTDYINNPNNKFGIWWETSALEIPIVENPPIPEALRLDIVNLPENPKLEYDATTMVSSRNPINAYFVNNNPDVFVNMGSPYGWAFQSEQWGSQNGLSYMWPWISYTAPGYFGPSKVCLAGGSYGVVYGPWGPGGAIFGRPLPTTEEWAGLGEPIGNGDINWAQAPWNTPTGYIGLTFGSTGFVSTGYIDKWISGYTWIPNKYRVFQPNRSWRAIDNQTNAIEGLEKTTYLRSDSKLEIHNTPWLKRKINFVRAELSAVYKRLKSQGFTFAHFDLDDEYYSEFLDLRNFGVLGGVCSAPATSSYFSGWTGLGNTYVYNTFMYPANSATGASWYSSFAGQSAAPDSLVAEGITSMRGLFLARGFTTNPNNIRYVDGLTALGNQGVTGNIIRSGSAYLFLGLEHYSVLKDWLAYMWTDMVNDFKGEMGITADNSLSGDYGYFDTRGAMFNYYKPGWTSAYVGKYANTVSKSPNSIVPYVENVTGDGDVRVTRYYAYNQTIGGGGVGTPATTPLGYQTQVGDIGIIHPYGSVQWDITSNVYYVLDRNNEYAGNSYGNSISGITQNIGHVPYYILNNAYYNNYTPRPSFMYDARQAIKWFPQGIFGIPNLPPQGYSLGFLSCAETTGQTGFFRYDPTGANGSCAANPLKVATDRSPHYVSWFLNPVWGITPQRMSENASVGPANYVPFRGLEIRDGLSFAAVTKTRTAGNTSLSGDNFDACGNPYPGNTLPAGTVYNHYWTHWYPLGFMALLGDVKWGRGLAATNVSKANYERENPTTAPRKAGSIWFGVQKPIASWIASQLWVSDNNSQGKLDLSYNQPLGSAYYIPEGITFNYYLQSSELVGLTYQATARGITYVYGENGPMAYECIRHQYLNKTNRFAYWNPSDHCYVTSESNTPIHCTSGQFPAYYPPQAVISNPRTPNRGITGLGVCGAIRMRLARKVNNVVGECQNLGKGIVYETISLDPVNMDERSYIASGAQLVDGSYLWRITFAHPATQSPIIVRGSVTGITTAYSVNGVTDYINIPNSKFGVWWTSNYYETPIVENPPVSEAERLNVLNLPEKPAYVYNPFTMTQGDLIPQTPKDLFYVQISSSVEGTPSGERAKWLGNNIPTIATFQGSRYSANQGGVCQGRPYAFEYDPANPTVSSPWHNSLYELAVDPYMWGIRSFLIYWPMGSFPQYNYVTRYLDLWDSGYYNSFTDASRCPSRIRGFTSAVKNMLEGKLNPTGYTSMSEPCNVLLYMKCQTGFYTFRWGGTGPAEVGTQYYPGSLNFWDRCYQRAGNTAAANALYYSYLDRFVDDILSMRGGPTAGKLTVGFDSMANSANPGTMHLFTSLPSEYTRGLSYEMGDWYVYNKLRNNGIQTYVEARPLKVFSMLDNGGLTSGSASNIPGICGATAISLWNDHLSVEYNMWFTDPDVNKSSPFFQKFVPNSDTSTVFRWVQNTGPLGTTYDPYKVPLTVLTGGTSWTISYNNGATTWYYTPHQSLFALYTASDVYRKHKNYTKTGMTFAGVAYDYFTKGLIIEYPYFSRGLCGNNEVNPTNNAGSLTGYYRVQSNNAFSGNRIGYGKERAFNEVSFAAGPTAYGIAAGSNNSAPGWWTERGMSFWIRNVAQASFTGFIQMLENLSSEAIPTGGNSAGWTGTFYPFDSYSNGVIPPSMRIPERTPLYAFAWSWPNQWVWSGNYWTATTGITNQVAFSGDLNTQTIANSTSSVWVYQNIKSNIQTGILAPDNTNTAFAFGTTGNGSCGGGFYAAIRQQIYNVKPGTTYTFSYYRNISLGATGGSFRFRDITGSVAASDIQPALSFAGSGWVRYQYTFATAPTQTALDFYILSRSNSATELSGVTVYLWGPQLEEGLTATPYTRTSGFRDARGGCIGTTGPIYDYNETAWLNYGVCNGISYISPFVNFYRISGWELSNVFGWTMNSEITRISSQLKKLPSGRRAFQPTLFNREDWYRLDGDKVTATGMVANDFFGNSSPYAKTSQSNFYPGPWSDYGISAGVSFYTELLNIFGNTGATLDVVLGDNEAGYLQNFSMTPYPGSITGYVNDPRYAQSWRGLSSWKSFMDFYGVTASNIAGPSIDKVAYLVWNNIGQQHLVKTWNEAFAVPTLQRYPNALVGNYGDFMSEGGPTAGPPDPFGHPQFNSSYPGNAPSPFLYGEITQIDWRTSANNVKVNITDPTYLNLLSGAAYSGSTLERGPWTSLTLALQELRSIKRATPYATVIPWIPSVRYSGGLANNGIVTGATLPPSVGWADANTGYNQITGLTHGVAGNSAYYYEMVRHVSLHGIKAIGYWNSTSFQWYDTPPVSTTSPDIPDREYFARGYTFYVRDLAHLDNVLREVNTKVGGYSPTTITTDRISWLSTYIASGAPGPTGGYVWRVTVKPGLTLLANGVTLSSRGSTVGTWIWTSGPTLTGVGLTFI